MLVTPCPKCGSKTYLDRPFPKGQVASCFECGYNPVKYWKTVPEAERLLEAEVIGEPTPATGQSPTTDSAGGQEFTSDLTSLVLAKYVYALTGELPEEHADELSLN